MWYPRLAAVLAGPTIVASVGCSSAGSGPVSTLAPEDLDLSGSWILNVEQSDNPEQMMREGGMGGGAMGGRRPGGGGARPSGGRTGRGGMRGGAPSQADQQRMQQTMRMATQPPRRIVIEQHDSTVTIRPARGRTELLLTNWRKVSQEIENGGQVDIRARWRGRELHIEREVHLGGKVTQQYSLSSDGERLLVETQLEMGRGGQPRVFHYVYDAVNDPN